INEYFTGASSRIEGVGLEQLARDAIARHKTAFEDRPQNMLQLDFGGEYSFRDDGEQHLWNPITVSCLQHAVTGNDPKVYEQYADAANQQARKLCTLRGLFEFAEGTPVPLEEVEPAS